MVGWLGAGKKEAAGWAKEGTVARGEEAMEARVWTENDDDDPQTSQASHSQL